MTVRSFPVAAENVPTSVAGRERAAHAQVAQSVAVMVTPTAAGLWRVSSLGNRFGGLFRTLKAARAFACDEARGVDATVVWILGDRSGAAR